MHWILPTLLLGGGIVLAPAAAFGQAEVTFRNTSPSPWYLRAQGAGAEGVATMTTPQELGFHQDLVTFQKGSRLCLPAFTDTTLTLQPSTAPANFLFDLEDHLFLNPYFATMVMWCPPPGEASGIQEWVQWWFPSFLSPADAAFLARLAPDRSGTVHLAWKTYGVHPALVTAGPAYRDAMEEARAKGLWYWRY